jgi:hypothetical protein
MTRTDLLRVVTLPLAFVHSFPASKHLALFFAQPSLDEAWKGFGACVAVGLYLLPPLVQARALGALFRRHSLVLSLVALALAAAHGVPALDHLPRFAASPSWGDGWRGFGAAAAFAWFLVPLAEQARVLALLLSLGANRLRAVS